MKKVILFFAISLLGFATATAAEETAANVATEGTSVVAVAQPAAADAQPTATVAQITTNNVPAENTEETTGSGWTDPKTIQTIIMFALIFIVFYFFLIRPQRKKQKEEQKLRDAISVGDKVITAGGVYGKVKEVKENTFVLEIADGVKITISKASVFASAADTAAKTSETTKK